MMRLIFKNISANRKRNKWLFAELVVVTVILWSLLDPMVVMTYNNTLPDGFNVKGLYYIELKELPSDAVGYDSLYSGEKGFTGSVERLLEKVRKYPDIKNATILFGTCAPYFGSISMRKITKDSLSYRFYVFDFLPKSDFFKTFEFDELNGFTNAGLDTMNFEHQDVVLSVDALPGCESLGLNNYKEDELKWTVVATVPKIRVAYGVSPVTVMLEPRKTIYYEYGFNLVKILFRVKEGTDELAFRNRFNEFVNEELRDGNMYASSLASYEDLKNDSSNGNVSFTLHTIMAAFFLLSLLLGVSGAFFMQTRNRREDIGIMKSFGGSTSYITAMMVGEGCIIATVATLAGCVIVAVIKYYFGIFEEMTLSQCNPVKTWADVYWQHMLVVSFIVWIIQLVIVCIGVALPASRLSRITPVEALRDE